VLQRSTYLTNFSRTEKQTRSETQFLLTFVNISWGDAVRCNWTFDVHLCFTDWTTRRHWSC